MSLKKLKSSLNKDWKYLKKEISGHKAIYILLTITFLGGLFVGVYRVGELLGFYFDQGRDALVIWDLWHNANFFLIGPTTGIAGIFRGPFYYYLIAPFYLVGGGNPVVPAVFLSFTTMLAVLLIYYLGFKIQDRRTGLMASVIASFSFNIILASRWLSNPAPMLVLSMILLWMMFLVLEKKMWAWIVIAFVSGLSLFHFGSSGEVYYFAAVLVFVAWMYYKQKRSGKIKYLPSRKISLLSLGALLFTVLPLIAFDFLHEHILSSNIRNFLLFEGSFKSSFAEVAQLRFSFYYDAFTSQIFHIRESLEIIVLAILTIGFLVFLPKLYKNDKVKVVLLLLVAPIIGLLFFQGNFGNLYGYYLTGYFLIFILLVAIVLGQFMKQIVGIVFVVFFFFVFFSREIPAIAKITVGGDKLSSITLGVQIDAVDWVYQDAAGRDFNVDVYVPPVIPHAYDYLFKWYGLKQYNQEPVKEQIELLYTLSEVDPGHPDRIEAWEARQRGIGLVEESVWFDGIKVERRKRL